MLWTLPNTAFGLAIEVSCLLGEVVRWLVWAVTRQCQLADARFRCRRSGRLNAFALVFKGGWLGSFESLLGITFGNVIFVNGEYQDHPCLAGAARSGDTAGLRRLRLPFRRARRSTSTNCGT